MWSILPNFAQNNNFIIYSWHKNKEPLDWVTNTINGNDFTWNKPPCRSLTTNCEGLYSNNTNSSFTSPIINTSLNNQNVAIIQFDVEGNLEQYKDWLYVYCSLDGGITWQNPLGANVGITGEYNHIKHPKKDTSTIVLQVPASVNFKFKFQIVTNSTNNNIGYKITYFTISNLYALPIELISFDAKLDINNNVLTNWITASEHNNNYFEVFNSIDGVNYTSIGKVQGSGNSTTSNKYELTHIKPNEGINYYKLKQVDFDGKYTYSKIIIIDVPKIDINSTIIIYYNMLGQLVNIDYSKEGYYIKVTIIDKTIKKEKIYKSNI